MTDVTFRPARFAKAEGSKVSFVCVDTPGSLPVLSQPMSPWKVQPVFSELPITMTTAVRSGLLPLHHRDPFDRLLVAQAQSLKVAILSADAIFDRYKVKRLW